MGSQGHRGRDRVRDGTVARAGQKLCRWALGSLMMGAATASTPASLGAQIHVPRDYPTMQAAINASQRGDHILVAPGVYREAINLLGKYIQLRSTGGAAATTIDATGLSATAVQCGSVNGPEQVIEGFTITGGVADSRFYGGGGMHIGGGSPTILNCRFVSNRAPGTFPGGLGGGLTASLSFPTAINCEFIGNHADDDGGAVAVVEGVITLINCTIVANDSLSTGGVTAWDAEIFLYNSIVRGNSPAADQVGCCVAYPFHSNIEGGPSGDGNIDADALFVRDPDAGPDDAWGTPDDDPGDLRLRPGSPCIAAGDDSAVPSGILYDVAGLPRFADGDGQGGAIVDIGAHERPRPGDTNGDGAVNVIDLLAVLKGGLG